MAWQTCVQCDQEEELEVAIMLIMPRFLKSQARVVMKDIYFIRISNDDWNVRNV